MSPLLFCASCRNCITGYTNVCLKRKLVGIHETGLWPSIWRSRRGTWWAPRERTVHGRRDHYRRGSTPFYAISERVALRAGRR